MKKFILFLIIVCSTENLVSQICNSPRFTEVPVYGISQIHGDTGIVYGHAINWLGADETLSLNIAYPKLAVDTMLKRPLVFLIHPGGFATGSKDDMDLMVYQFARRGFISVTIDYRLGRDCSGDSLSYNKATYRAMQDAQAAMRFIINMADSIRLDTSRIFIGGESAGSITALATVYISQTEMNLASPTLHTLLGDLNASTNTLTNTFSLKGIFNNWGGIAADFFQSSDALPTISFHGDMDTTVYIDSAYGGSCLNPPKIYGSNVIYDKMLQWGICNQTSVKVGGGHGVYNNSSASIDFRVAKASCFFKSIMCGSCYSYYSTDSIPADCSVTLSTEMENLHESYLVYPNPVKDVLYVKTGSVSGSINRLNIYDLSGRLLQSSMNKNEISVVDLPNGIYILQINRNGEVANYKFVKN